MYADHLRSRRIDPVSLGGAALIGGAILAALINVAPQIMPKIDKGLTWVDIHPDPVPLPPPPEPTKDVKTEAKSDEKVYVTPPIVSSDASTTMETTLDPPPPGPIVITPVAPVEPVAPPPPPAMIGAEVDPRYADDFQPPYPADKLREEAEGVVTVRVQIGVDGRVKSIDPVGKADSSFFEATKRQAMKLWRFKPATRGGVPVESSKTMTVRFRITAA